MKNRAWASLYNKIVQIKIIILLSLILVVNTSFITVFKKLPKSFLDRDNLIKNIDPDKQYTYWEYCSGGIGLDFVTFKKGVRTGESAFKNPGEGFFRGCLPSYCYRYIAYIRNDTIGYVTNAQELKKLLGRINTLEEAVLLAEVSGELDVDNNLSGGSYREYNNGYILKLMKHTFSPETKQSIYLKIDREKGIVQERTLNTYYRSRAYVVF